MEEHSSEVAMPRRRTSRYSKPMKRPTKRQLQQSHGLPNSRSQPHGDEISFTQSQLHGQAQEQTEDKLPEGTELAPAATSNVTEDTEVVACPQGEKIIIAIERTDPEADSSKCVGDLDLKDLRSQCVCDLVFHDDLDSASSETSITRVPTAIAELITHRRGFKSKENQFARTGSFNEALENALSNASLSLMMADCMPLVNFASPKYVSMKSKEVPKKSHKRNYIFTTRLIILASTHALPLSRMIAEYIPKQAAFSVISGNSMKKILAEQRTMNCAELQSWGWAGAHPVESLHDHHVCMCDDDVIGEEVLEGELEVSVLGSPVVSTSLIFESSLANGLDSSSCSCSPSALATDSSTTSSTSTTSTTTTNFWKLVEHSLAPDTEEVSEMENVAALSACSLSRTEIRRMSIRWATGSCFFLSALFVVKCYYAELLRGDWLSIAGIVAALCTIVFISLSRQLSAS